MCALRLRKSVLARVGSQLSLTLGGYEPVSLTYGYLLSTVVTVLYIPIRKNQNKVDLKKKKRDSKKKNDARLGTRKQRLGESMNQYREHSERSNLEHVMTSERIVPDKRNLDL